MNRTVNVISGRLSLRAPQSDSLERLAQALEQVPALRDHRARSPEELKQMLEALKAQFATLSDFEREFPSLCFSLATGVGKTRLMGAFIGYLHAAYGYRHFFVLAPNLTIYDKLIRDFSPGTPKYVFKGISEFAVTVPEVVTGDNYEQRGTKSLLGGIEVNIFNISKINSEVRGGKSPRIKRLSEYLGQSYFDYLANLEDLVLIMDESHRYRASAGIRALNDLRPLIGLELTATPFTESNKGPVPFKNVVMDYPLARAIEDGFVKEPAVVTQQNFDASAHSPEQLERIKLMDGVRVHEETKVHLLTYAQQTGDKLVKPFMLVIARDTTHASQLMVLIKSDGFFAGRYANKVIQVDSGTTSGSEGDEVIQRLLAVESYDEPTEIVIHVNMLKEGWDVTNLYTIVPLRAANARTLIEQSIGRGLRLPYGRKTGVEAVDRLNIIAHDRFDEVIQEAGRGDSPIRLRERKLTPIDGMDVSMRSVPVTPTVDALLGIDSTSSVGSVGGSAFSYAPAKPVPGMFSGNLADVARIARDVINDMSRMTSVVPTTASLIQASVQQEIVKRVEELVSPKQAELLPTDGPSIADIVKQTSQVLMDYAIDIPRILVKPKGPVRSGYKKFTLDVSKLRFQPQDQQLIGRGLQSGNDILYGRSSAVGERRFEDYIVRELVDKDDVSYDNHADLLYELAGQALAHFKSYLKTDEELHNVLGNQAKAIADNIHAQMAANYFEDIGESEVVVSQGFTSLKPSALTTEGDVLTLPQTPPDKGKIAQLVYGGFAKCAYTFQKFQSDTERVVALILERDSLRWFRPVGGQFNIFYRKGAFESEYIPDFVALTADANLLIETKAARDVDDAEVKAKAQKAILWCKHASEYSQRHGGKLWKYVLIPHDEVTHGVTLKALVGRFSI